MPVNRDNLSRAQVLLALVLDAKMDEEDAQKLLGKAYAHPGDWRESGKVRIRKEIQGDLFSVRA